MIDPSTHERALLPEPPAGTPYSGRALGMNAALLALALTGLSPGPALARLPPAPAPLAQQEDANEHAQYEYVRLHERIESDGTRVTADEVRVLLRTAFAVSSLGRIGSSYVEGFGEVRFESVLVEKPDGSVRDGRGGHVEDANPFSDLHYKALTVPGLEAGDVLEYRIVTTSKPLFEGHVFGQAKLMPWPGAPRQTYTLDVPDDAEIRVHVREGLEDKWETLPAPPGRRLHRLMLTVDPQDLDGDATQAEITEWRQPDVEYSSFDSWAEVGRWWWGLSEAQLAPAPPLAKQARELTSGLPTDRAKIEALHRFVASKIRYESVGLGVGRMRPRSAPEVLRSLYGDCKDKHVLMAGLASSIGLDVRPVLISSVDQHLRDEAPAPHQFDHVVSVALLGPAPEDRLWLDGTQPYAIPGYLGPELREKRAVMIDDRGEGTVINTPAEPPFTPRWEVDLKGTLETDGVLKGRIVWRMRTDLEPRFRARFAATEQDEYVSLLSPGAANVLGANALSNIEISDPADTTKPFRIEFDVELEAVTGRAPERQGLSLNFGMLPVPEPIEGAAELRAFEYVTRAEVALPETLSAHSPLSVSLDRPFGRFESSYTAEGARLVASRSLSVPNRSVSGDELPAYEAFRRALKKDGEQQFSIIGEISPVHASEGKRLFFEGGTAFLDGDYAGAVDLYQKAADEDPTLENVFFFLGEALSHLGRDEEALVAFDRQIELDPYHERAYAWRARALMALDRQEEADAALLKQIEVAPLQPWSYSTLAWRRSSKGRFAEAAELYAKAAAIQPETARHWVDLAWARIGAGQRAEARVAIDAALGLELEDWLKIRAGTVFEVLQEPLIARELALSALTVVTPYLAGLSEESYDKEDLLWMKPLADAWYLIGAGALADGRLEIADRYLTAAWRHGYSPRSGWLLGELRERQGRLVEAIDLWRIASALPDANLVLPPDRESRVAAARERLPDHTFKDLGELHFELAQSHMVPLKGTAQLSAQVLLLIDSAGSVEHVRSVSPLEQGELERQMAALEPIQLALPRPDDKPIKLVRSALLMCEGQPCMLFMVPPSTNGELERQFAGRDPEPNWDAEQHAQRSDEHPLAGFWKEGGCDDDWGLAIGPMQKGTYYVSFCGPGGCFSRTDYRPETTIYDDPQYRVVDQNTIEVKGRVDFSTYHRCPGRATASSDPAAQNAGQLRPEP